MLFKHWRSKAKKTPVQACQYFASPSLNMQGILVLLFLWLLGEQQLDNVNIALGWLHLKRVEQQNPCALWGCACCVFGLEARPGRFASWGWGGMPVRSVWGILESSMYGPTMMDVVCGRWTSKKEKWVAVAWLSSQTRPTTLIFFQCVSLNSELVA